MIDPGKLNKKVHVLAPTVSYGSNGEPLETFGSYGYYWMMIEPAGGDEEVRMDAPGVISKAKFTARYNTDISEDYRFSWNSQTWDIVNISILGLNELMEFTCETTTPMSGDDTDYGDYYATNSLKIRVITGAIKAAATATQAEVNTAVGLTAVQAGVGYAVYIEFTTNNFFGLYISNGTVWRYVSFALFA